MQARTTVRRTSVTPVAAAIPARAAAASAVMLALLGSPAWAQSKPAAAQPPAKEEPKPAQPAPATTPAPAKEAVKDPAKPATAPAAKDPGYVLGYTVNGIDGKPVDLSTFAGKVVMIVNVASKCGLTPQYEGLQKLFKEHEKAGLVILGFPANNFMNQEPGSEAEILDFCKGKYNVTFPLFSKVSVKGADAHPLFKQLAGVKPPAGGEPSWNFTKYLVDRRGVVVARFDPKVRPDDPELNKRLKALLAEPAPRVVPAPSEPRQSPPDPKNPVRPGLPPQDDK